METVATLTIPAHLDQLAVVRRFILNAAASFPCSPETIHNIILATDEAITNIIEHGYQGHTGDIHLTLSKQANRCIIQLEDNAPPFDPNNAPKPDIQAPLAARPVGGLGIHLIRRLMDELHYQQSASGTNQLIMIKQCS